MAARKGSLLGVLDRTATSMGGRKLARWLAAPLCALPEIHARLDAVEELSQRSVWREELTTLLKEVADLERLCGRLSLGAGNARDLRALAVSLAQLPKLSAALSRCSAPLLKALAGPLSALPELAELLLRAVVDEPPVTIKEGGLFRQGFHAELDELVALSTAGKDYLLKLETRERERTKISSLKVRYNKVFGYLHRGDEHQQAPGAQRTTSASRPRWAASASSPPSSRSTRRRSSPPRSAAAPWSSALFDELRAQVVTAARPHPLGRRGRGDQRCAPVASRGARPSTGTRGRGATTRRCSPSVRPSPRGGAR